MGPLAGIKVIEFAGIGPCPMAAMMLAEMGATVLRIDRVADSDLGLPLPTKFETLKRSRHIIRLDLKRPEAVALTLRLIEQSDALIEGFRPKVMERLGLGPDVCLARNPRLVFGRVTGWGQEGPLAHAAGHDLNYIALTGALHAIGRAGGPPTPPLNLVGDFGGGALYLVVGVLAAIIEARQSGKGQVVDAAMVDGASSLMTSIYGGKASGRLSGAARHQRHRFRRLFLRGLRMRRRPLRLGGGDRGEVPRRTAAPAGDRPRDHAAADGPRALARGEGAARRALPHPHARRMVRAARRQRRLLRAGAVDGRGARPSAQPRAQRVRRSRWRARSPRRRRASAARRSLRRRRRNRQVRRILRTVLAEWGIDAAEVETSQASGLLA